jgi:hypothetical protein
MTKWFTGVGCGDDDDWRLPDFVGIGVQHGFGKSLTVFLLAHHDGHVRLHVHGRRGTLGERMTPSVSRWTDTSASILEAVPA